MNQLHRWYCRSKSWKRKLLHEVLPWSVSGVNLGDRVLEVGPGPGLSTDWLRQQCKSVVCVEIDAALAISLGHRTAGSNVSVRCGDATAMPFPDRTFSSVVSFTMLHHVPSQDLQDRLFAEAYRVLKPGGVFAGTDSMRSLAMWIFHRWDTIVLVDPVGLPARLEAAGFTDVMIEKSVERFRFLGRRPGE